MVDQRISFVTLAVADLDASRAFTASGPVGQVVLP